MGCQHTDRLGSTLGQATRNPSQNHLRHRYARVGSLRSLDLGPRQRENEQCTSFNSQP